MTYEQLKAGIDVTIPAESGDKPRIIIIPKDDNIYEISEKVALKIVEINSFTDENGGQRKTAYEGQMHDDGIIDDEDDPTRPPVDGKDGDMPTLNISVNVPLVIEGKEGQVIEDANASGNKTVQQPMTFIISRKGKTELESKVIVKPTFGPVSLADIKTIEFIPAEGSGDTAFNYNFEDINNDKALKAKIEEFINSGQEVTIPAGGDTDKTANATNSPRFIVTTFDDEITEPVEPFSMAMNAPKNAKLGIKVATSNIVDDRGTDNPEVDEDTKADKIIVEGIKDAVEHTNAQDEDDAYLEYTVRVSSPIGSDIQAVLSVDLSSTATAYNPQTKDGDYHQEFEYWDKTANNKKGAWTKVPADNTIWLPAEGNEETAVKVRIKVHNDAISEDPESVVLKATTTDEHIKPAGRTDTGKDMITDNKGTDNPDIDADTKAYLIVDNAGSIKEPRGDEYLSYDVYLSEEVGDDVNVKITLIDYDHNHKKTGKPYSSASLTQGESRQEILDKGWEPDPNGISDDRLLGNDIAQKLEWFNKETETWIDIPANGIIKLPAETVKSDKSKALKVRVQVHADELNEADEYIVIKAEVQPEDTNRISVKAADHNGDTKEYLQGAIYHKATAKEEGYWTFDDDGGDNYGVGVIEAGDQLRVSEEGLAWGWRDRDIYGRKGENTENSTDPDKKWDKTNSATSTRYMGFAPGFNVTEIQHRDGKDTGGTNLTSGGKQINWGWDAASQTLTGRVDIGNGMTEKVMDLHIADGRTGKNEVTLYRQIDHPDNTPLAKDDDILVNGQKLGGIEDIVNLNFMATATNQATGKKAEMNFSVIVEDDSPFINVIDAEINNTPSVNLLLTMDVSGSMTFVDFTDGSSQIIRSEVDYTRTIEQMSYIDPEYHRNAPGDSSDPNQVPHNYPGHNPSGYFTPRDPKHHGHGTTNWKLPISEKSNVISLSMADINLDPEGWKYYGVRFGNDIKKEEICAIQIFDANGNKVNDAVRWGGNTADANWRLLIDPNKYSKSDIELMTMKIVTQRPVDPGAKLTVELDADRATHAKEAFIELIEAYQNAGKIVNAKIVEFSNQNIKNYSPWLTGDNAIKFFKDGILANGGTDYAQALKKMMDTYQEGIPDAQDTISYFISDGAPSGDTYTQDVEMHNFEQKWLDFLAENNINNSYAIGVTAGLPTKHLNEVANSSEVNYENFKYDNGLVDNKTTTNSNHTHKDKDPATPDIRDGNKTETEANAKVLANPDDVVEFLLNTVKPGSASGNGLQAKKGRGKVISIIGADKLDPKDAIDDVIAIFHSQDNNSFIFENGSSSIAGAPKYKRVNGTAQAGDENMVYIYTDASEAHQEGTPFKYAEYITNINDGVLIFDKNTGKYHFEMTSAGVNRNDGKTYSYRVDVTDGDGDKSSAKINVTVDASSKSVRYTESLIAQGDHQPIETGNGSDFTVIGWRGGNSVFSKANGFSQEIKDWATLEGHGLEKAKIFAPPQYHYNIEGGMGVWSGDEAKYDNSSDGKLRDLSKIWKTHINVREVMQIKFDEDQTEIDASFNQNVSNGKNTAKIFFYKDGKLVGERGGDDIPIPNPNANPTEPNDYKVYQATNGQLFDEVRIIATDGEGFSVHNLVARNRAIYDKDDAEKDDSTYIITDNDFPMINDVKGWDILAVEGDAEGNPQKGVIDFTATLGTGDQAIEVAKKAKNMEMINLREDTHKQEITLDFDSIQTISQEDELLVLAGDNDIVKLKGTSITKLGKDHEDEGIMYDHYQLNKGDEVVDLYVSKGTTVQQVRDDGTPRSADPSVKDNTIGYSNDIEFTFSDTGAGYLPLVIQVQVMIRLC